MINYKKLLNLMSLVYMILIFLDTTITWYLVRVLGVGEEANIVFAPLVYGGTIFMLAGIRILMLMVFYMLVAYSGRIRLGAYVITAITTVHAVLIGVMIYNFRAYLF